MNMLIEKNVIKELECGTNFAYILSDNSHFLSTEYKVLQSQTDNCFVKCMKTLYNGNIQLYYVTKGLKTFASMIPVLDEDRFLTIAANLLSDIIDVKHNGFLSCRNIDISFERIYIDPTTYKVSLVYLPLSQRLFEDTANFENELRTGLIKLIYGVKNLSSEKTTQFATDLANGTFSIENLFARIKGGNQPVAAQQKPQIQTMQQSTMRLIALNAPNRFELVVRKIPFVIGKKADMCDGIIGYNTMISRTHCEITKQGAQYCIRDLQSANGTYVNKVRLQPNKLYILKNGDIIRLANSGFQVRIG